MFCEMGVFIRAPNSQKKLMNIENIPESYQESYKFNYGEEETVEEEHNDNY